MTSSDRDKRLRAELAEELGYFVADLDRESVARHRRLNATYDTSNPSDRAHARDRLTRKYEHLREAKQRNIINDEF